MPRPVRRFGWPPSGKIVVGDKVAHCSWPPYLRGRVTAVHPVGTVTLMLGPVQCTYRAEELKVVA